MRILPSCPTWQRRLSTRRPKSTKPKMPGIITAICIVSLLLGLGGLVSCFFSIASTLILSVALNVAPQGSPPQALQATDFLQGRIRPTLFTAGLNFRVAPLLIVGSISTLCSKQWGLPLLRWALICTAVAIVVKGGLTIRMQLAHLNFPIRRWSISRPVPTVVLPRLPN